MMTVTGSVNSNNDCPLWHLLSDIQLGNVNVAIPELQNVHERSIVHVVHGYCVMWNNITPAQCGLKSATVFSLVMMICVKTTLHIYDVLTNLSEPDLNFFTQ